MVCSQNSRPKNSILQSINDEVLGEYQRKGFNIREIGDHELRLFYKDELVCRMNQETSFISLIRAACRAQLIKEGVE